jgi:GAF domain-containing protein/HAMP domain-containing protein
MIDRFLRALPVRRRIVSAFLILVVLLALSVPLIAANQSFLVGRLRQVTDVEARADRSLLLASARIESSRVNLMRYVQDYAPSVYEARDDVDQAVKFLTEAQSLITAPEQKTAVETVLTALNDYKTLISGVETARSGGASEGQDVSRILFQAYRLGNDIGQRIEQIVNDSEARIAQVNKAIYAEARNRLILLGSGYVVLVVLALILASLIQRSITRPVAELREGAEAFRQGNMDVTVPVVGADELSLLAQTFNQMAAQLHGLVGSLEQRVTDRTRDLERRAIQLATAVDVGRAAASTLGVELESLIQQVADLIRERFELYYVGLFLLDEENRYAVLQAGTGEAGRAMKEQGHKLEVGGMSMVGTACARRQARIALDVGEEPIRFDNPLLPETRSELALPLIAANRVLGALDVQSTQPAAFSTEDIAVLQLVADQVAVAIQNARLFAEVEMALEAERRAYGEISRRAWEQFSRTQAQLGYCSDERGLSPVSDLWPSREQMEAALLAGEPELGALGIAEAAAYATSAGSLAIPIRVRDQEIGVIDARKPDGSGEWTEEEIALLETLVDQLGVALDSARLYEDTQRRAARERTIRYVTDQMRRAVDVEAILQNTVAELARAMGAPRAYVRLGMGVGLEPSGGPAYQTGTPGESPRRVVADQDNLDASDPGSGR